MSHTTLLHRPNIFSPLYQNTSTCNSYFPHYCQRCTSNKYAPQMSYLYHIYKLVCMQISDNYISKYASYELTTIDNMIRNTSIHTFHIIGIYPWTNIPTRLHIYFPVHCYCGLYVEPTLLPISVKNNNLQLLWPCYCHICSKKYASQMPNTCHMPKILDVNQWKKCGNKYATDELVGTNNVTRTAVRRCLTIMLDDGTRCHCHCSPTA